MGPDQLASAELTDDLDLHCFHRTQSSFSKIEFLKFGTQILSGGLIA